MRKQTKKKKEFGGIKKPKKKKKRVRRNQETKNKLEMIEQTRTSYQVTETSHSRNSCCSQEPIVRASACDSPSKEDILPNSNSNSTPTHHLSHPCFLLFLNQKGKKNDQCVVSASPLESFFLLGLGKEQNGTKWVVVFGGRRGVTAFLLFRSKGN